MSIEELLNTYFEYKIQSNNKLNIQIAETYRLTYSMKNQLSFDIFNDDGSLKSDTFEIIKRNIKKQERKQKLKKIFDWDGTNYQI